MRSDNELNEMIGNNVYKLRISHDLSVKELANLIDYADSSLHLIETGVRGTSACTLVKIADALGVTLDQLVNKSIDEASSEDQIKLNKIFAICRSIPAKELNLVIQILTSVHRHSDD
ncbi:MAG: helix-turn-helix domain-containing protein [Defluviitaleaceae bacterium]|nr:helix-turn-helix domain-containing protein [Defluviitaleaceae bacterium]